MFVAHAFTNDGTLIYVRGGFTTQAAATAQARTILGASAGAWAVVDATMAQYARWVMGDHGTPVSGPLRAFGGSQKALLIHWPAGQVAA